MGGCGLREDFAISDSPYRLRDRQDANYIRFGSNEIAYSSVAEKNLFLHELESLEQRNLSGRRSFSYPIIAGSSGTSDYYDKKYKLIENLATWREANETAKNLNGRLLSIESEAEETLLLVY